MGYSYFKGEGVEGHVHFDDYCFRFLFYTVWWSRGPIFYINFKTVHIGLKFSDFRRLTFKQIWWKIRYSTYITTYEKMIEPGTYHVIWFIFNRWYKKNSDRVK